MHRAAHTGAGPNSFAAPRGKLRTTLHDYHSRHDKVNATNNVVTLDPADLPVACLTVGAALPFCYPLRTDDATAKNRFREGSEHRAGSSAAQCDATGPRASTRAGPQRSSGPEHDRHD